MLGLKILAELRMWISLLGTYIQLYFREIQYRLVDEGWKFIEETVI